MTQFNQDDVVPPLHAVGAFALNHDGTDYTLTVGELRPVYRAGKDAGSSPLDRPFIQWLLTMHLSPGRLKMLQEIVNEQVRKHEVVYGPIGIPPTALRNADGTPVSGENIVSFQGPSTVAEPLKVQDAPWKSGDGLEVIPLLPAANQNNEASSSESSWPSPIAPGTIRSSPDTGSERWDGSAWIPLI